MKWYVYILKCSDNSFYTGITIDTKRREYEHNHDKIKGAKSLRGKLPVKMIYTEMHDNQTNAARREKEIKGWKREKKLKLIMGLP